MNKKSKLIKPENTLKKKAGNGGFNETDLVKAQTMIQTNQIDFRPLGVDMLKELNEIMDGIKAGTVTQQEYFDKLMYPLMQLKSQGSLFRYPSVTQISQIMIDLLENIKEIDKNALEIVAAYAKSLQAILTLQIKEVENKVAKDLCKALSDACDRYFKLMEKTAK
jgi:hypothetical protein